MARRRAIAHMDLDAFFAAVHVLENPALDGKPVVVGGRPEGRGVVATASYSARKYGIHSAMPMYKAVELCSDLIIVPPEHGLYRRYSRQVMEIVRDSSPLVEQMSVDEAYLDWSAVVVAWEEAVDLGSELQARIRAGVGLTASLGIATNKLVAKVASDRDKPEGLTIVRPGEEAAFLAPLPVRVLWGIGPVTAAKLAEMGIERVGELAQVPEEELRQRFGQHGGDMSRHARGIDDRPVVTQHERKSVSQERTFRRDVTQLEPLKRHLWKMSQGVAERLQRAELAAGTVAIKVRYADFTTFTRQMSLMLPTDNATEIYRTALVLLDRSWERERPIRLLGVAGHQLDMPPRQMRLW
jgi:DNA polymerase-4